MNFVWFTSYLCVFIAGMLTMLYIAYKIVNRSIDKYEKELAQNAEQMPLAEKLAPYTFIDPTLN